MAVREIKTSIALDGEQAFKQAIADANRNLRVMDSELKAAAAEFKTSGDAQQFYTEKSKNLKEQIAQQEQIVNALTEKLRQSAEATNGNSAQTDAWSIKLNNAKARLAAMKKDLQDTDRVAEEFGRDSRRVGRQIEDGIGDGAEEANKSVKSLIESLQEDVGSIKGSMAFQVASTVTQGIVNVVQSVGDFVESNRDYRRAMAQFEQAAENAGYSKDTMEDMLNSLAVFTGDFDGAREALTLMMQTGLNEDWIKTATDIFSYASLIFKGSLDIQGLAEDFQETVASGEVQGKLDEYLNRVGGKKDELEKIMSDVDSTEEKAIAALTYMAQEGYTDTLNQYNERTEAIQNAEKAQLELADAWAGVSEKLEPLTTKMTVEMTEVVKLLGDTIDELMPVLDSIVETIGALARKAVGVINDINELGIFGLFGTHAGETDEEAKAAVEASLKNQPSKEDLESYLPSNYEAQKAAIEAGKAAGEEYAIAIVDAASSTLLDDMQLNDVLMQVLSAYDSGPEAAQERLDKLKLTEEQKQQVIDEMEKLGFDMTSKLDTSIKTGMEAAGANAATAGQNAGIKLGNGLAAGLSNAYNTTLNYVNAINSLLSGVGNTPAYGLSGGGYYNGMGGTSRIKVTVPLSINGREVARATMPYINSMQGQQTSRESRISK